MPTTRSDKGLKTTKTEALIAITPVLTGPAKIERLRSVSAEQVAQRAYAIFEARGRQHGRDLEDWLQAERELHISQVADGRRHNVA